MTKRTAKYIHAALSPCSPAATWPGRHSEPRRLFFFFADRPNGVASNWQTKGQRWRELGLPFEPEAAQTGSWQSSLCNSIRFESLLNEGNPSENFSSWAWKGAQKRERPALLLECSFAIHLTGCNSFTKELEIVWKLYVNFTQSPGNNNNNNNIIKLTAKVLVLQAEQAWVQRDSRRAVIYKQRRGSSVSVFWGFFFSS